jgi:DNA invertase Pin-like site-specific DNA recombinase
MKQDRQSPGNNTNKRRSCRKEISAMQFIKSNRDEHGQEESRVSRVAIYLCEPSTNDGITEPSVPCQLAACRRTARRQKAEVVGEFLDIREFRSLRPGLHQALEAAQEQRLDYLIVWSLDLLADSDEDAFEAAWHLGQAGTIPIFVYEDV